MTVHDGDQVRAAVEGGPGFTGTVLDVDLEIGEVLIECDQCGSNTAHLVPIEDVETVPPPTVV